MTQAETQQQHIDPIRARVMAQAREIAGTPPRPQLRSIVCPYCGSVTPDSGRCSQCNGRFDPLSRQATQNQMGPWEIRDDRVPFRPGCSYTTLTRLVDQGVIKPETVLRGPSTRQFWMLAKHAPGVAHKLGVCHNCQTHVKPDAFSCPNCQATFEVERDRQHLGLGPARPLPGQGLPEVLALHAEPASVDIGKQVASTSIAAPSTSSPMRSGTQAPSDGLAAADQLARSQLEDANRLVRQWRERANLDRQHAWVVILVSSLITLTALGYVYRAAFGANGTVSPLKSESDPGLIDE